jgi:hypothetical protein
MFFYRFQQRFLFTGLFLLVIFKSQGQFASDVLEFLPAPGQYTNAESVGTPAAAASLKDNNRGLVSLGGFGGSIVLSFSQGIKNDPDNPYGVDFTILGNTTPNWSEPGIVQVMKDENNNGLPDDLWYEIAGSDHYLNNTVRNYEITYLNNGLAVASAIHWNDIQGNNGVIPKNSYHLQPYYPSSKNFSSIPSDRYTLKGTKIKGQIDFSTPGSVNSLRRSFGYADNTPVISASIKLPDNPYTSEIEGSGGDAIDISWAVDALGKSVLLDEIHFIRIYTGMNAIAGWLGEISTEITGIRDVEPAVVKGQNQMIVMSDLPAKLMAGQSVQLQALIFGAGKLNELQELKWTLSKPELASFENGQLKALSAGSLRIRAGSAINKEIFSERSIEIFEPGSASILVSQKSLNVNDQLEINGNFTDAEGNVLTGLAISWSVDQNSLAEIELIDGKYFLKGKRAGTCWVFMKSVEYPGFSDSITIQVLPESVLKKIFVSVKTTEKTLIPRRSFLIGASDLNFIVDRAKKIYPLSEPAFVSLAHVIAAISKTTESSGEWAFRDDLSGENSLYLWRVPEYDTGSVVYHFGYGGSQSSSAQRKTWVVMINQEVYLSGLDQIKVNNNDEILIYQIEDNQISWPVTRLTASKDTLQLNQKVDLELMKYICKMNPDRSVQIVASEVLAYQSVQIVIENSIKSAITYRTDEFGKLAVIMDKPGDYLFSSGIDALKIIVESTTNLHDSKGISGFRLFPNPFTDKLFVESALDIDQFEIINLQGQVVYKSSFTGNAIDLSFLEPGIYFFCLQSDHEIIRQKIVKN